MRAYWLFNLRSVLWSYYRKIQNPEKCTWQMFGYMSKTAGEFNKILNMCRNVTEIHPIVAIFPSGKNGGLATVFSRVGIALSLHVIPAIILYNYT